MKIQFAQTETTIYELSEEDTQKIIERCVEQELDENENFVFWEQLIQRLLELDNIIPLLLKKHCEQKIEKI